MSARPRFAHSPLHLFCFRMVDPSHPAIDPLAGVCRFSDQTLPEPLPADPMPLLDAWLREAAAAATQPNPNAMSLATLEPDGTPAARIVLCRKFDPGRGFLVFYTNRHGAKGRQIAATPRAAALFHWDHLDRQVRVVGPLTVSPDAESDAYFAGRPVMSRIAAWASEQSSPIGSRAALLEQNARAEARFGIERGPDGRPRRSDGGDLNALSVPRPPHWGGFRLWVQRIEFWLGHSNRLHDRAAWSRPLSPASVDAAAGFAGGAWSATRLQP